MNPARAQPALALLLTAAGLLGACRAAPGTVPRTAPGSRPQAADRAALDELRATLEALYAAFDFDAGREPDWEAQRRIYLPGASFVPPLQPDRTPVAQDTEAFLAAFRDFAGSEPYRSTGFHERIVGLWLERFGNLAQALVAFEGFEPHGATAGPAPAVTRGLDSIQLVHDGRSWRVASFATQYEREGLELPGRFLTGVP